MNYKNETFVIADIPGLIEGAHNGTGLGHKFLSHIERCPALLHLISLEEDDIIKSYEVIRNEILKYGNQIHNKEEIIILNKIDLYDKVDIQDKINNFSDKVGKDIIIISAEKSLGIEELKNKLLQITDKVIKGNKKKEKWQP